MCESIVLAICVLIYMLYFFFKQKTAYEMRISDWSSDVCSSDLNVGKLEIFKLEKNLSSIATIAGAAPMMGFLGTVIGMVQAFKIGRASCRERVCQYV